MTLEYEAKQWEARASITEYRDEKGAGPSKAHLEGAAAYAHSQAAVRRRLRDRFSGLWREVDLPQDIIGDPEDVVEEVQPVEEMQIEEEEVLEELEGEVQEQEHAEDHDN